MEQYIKDIAAVTSADYKTLKKIQDAAMHIHSNNVFTQSNEGQPIIELPTLEGTILIKVENDNVIYKFIPNEMFDTTVMQTLKNNKSTLTKSVEEKLKKIMVKTYKDIL